MGTLHIRRDLVVAVTMDEHKIAFLMVLMISIHVVDFQYVFVSKVELTIAASAFLLFEHSGSAWG
jgi:hypothetical protein